MMKSDLEQIEQTKNRETSARGFLFKASVRFGAFSTFAAISVIEIAMGRFGKGEFLTPSALIFSIIFGLASICVIVVGESQFWKRHVSGLALNNEFQKWNFRISQIPIAGIFLGVLLGVLGTAIFWRTIGFIYFKHEKQKVIQTGFHFDKPVLQPSDTSDKNFVTWYERIQNSGALKNMSEKKSAKEKSVSEDIIELVEKARYSKLDEADIAELSKDIAPYQNALASFSPAWNCTVVNWNFDPSKSISNWAIPHVAPAMGIARLKAGRILVLISQNRIGEAKIEFNQLLILADDIKLSPYLVNQMISIWIWNLAFDILRAAETKNVHLIDQPKIDIRKRVANIRSNFKRTMEFEVFTWREDIYESFDLFDALKKVFGNYLSNSNSVKLDLDLSGLHSDNLTMLFYYPFLGIDLASGLMPSSKIFDFFNNPASLADINSQETPNEFFRGSWFLSGGSEPRWVSMWLKALRPTAEIRLWELTEELKIWKKTHGNFPANLRMLGLNLNDSDKFQDPFGGNDFVYKVNQGRVKLYSVGMDGKDDGGRELGHRTEDTGDLVWKL